MTGTKVTFEYLTNLCPVLFSLNFQMVSCNILIYWERITQWLIIAELVGFQSVRSQFGELITKFFLIATLRINNCPENTAIHI